MASVTPETVLIAVGWAISLVVALKLVPYLAQKAWAANVSKKDSPARKAFAGAVREDVLPEVDHLLAKRLGDFDAQKQRVEDALVRLETTVKGIRLPDNLNIDVSAFGPLVDERLAAFAKSDLGRMWAAGGKKEPADGVREVFAGAIQAERDPVSMNVAAYLISKVKQGQMLGLIDEKAGARRIKQVQQFLAEGGDLASLGQEFGIDVRALAEQLTRGAQAGGAQTGGGGGPAQF